MSYPAFVISTCRRNEVLTAGLNLHIGPRHEIHTLRSDVKLSIVNWGNVQIRTSYSRGMFNLNNTTYNGIEKKCCETLTALASGAGKNVKVGHRSDAKRRKIVLGRAPPLFWL